MATWPSGRKTCACESSRHEGASTGERRDAGMLTLRIPRELKSPNKWQGRHWRYKHQETKTWEMEIAVQTLRPEFRRNIWAILEATNSMPAVRRTCQERRRVTVTRIVPSFRNFIRDDDNLRFSVKPLNDALKRLGLIKNDSRKWLVQPQVQQEVSPEGEWATVITIEPLGASSESREAPEAATRG